MPLISVDKLSLGYDSHAIADDISFNVNSGDYLCIVGENGSGKSTLMKTLLGLLAPIGGEITFGDGLNKNEIGYLPQQTDVQRDFPASVWEVVLSGCANRQGLRPFYSKADKLEASENIKKMSLDGMEKRCYRELSGGQQQRVLLARALCAAGKIILLDEPVAGLDPKVTLEMYQLIESLNKDDGITVIMISHDIQAAVHYASHILHLGKSVFFGTKDEYLVSDTAGAFVKGGHA